VKGVQGLMIAGFFGLLGIVLNWLYLQQKASDLETTTFLGVRRDTTIAQGEVISRDDLVGVPIPDMHARRLSDFVFTYKELPTVAGTRATRDYQGGDFIHREHYRTPPPKLDLQEDERLIWVPVSGAVPSLLNPGDRIKFVIPATGRTTGGEGMENPIPLTSLEEIGPFTIKSLGNRLSSSDVWRGNRLSQSREREIGVVVREEGGKLEPKAIRLLELLNQSNRRNISVILYPREKEES